MERRTPLYDYHAAHAKKMLKGGGDYVSPDQFSDAAREHANTRTNVGMQDLSTMGELDVKGPDAGSFLNSLTVNDLHDLQTGQVRYTTICNERGGIIDDLTVYKRADDHYMVVTSSGPRKRVAAWMTEKASGKRAYVTDISAAVALPVVQGPRSREVLHSVVEGADVAALKFFRFTPARVGETEVLISRSGYTGELGYEVYTPAEEAHLVWARLLEAGKPLGLEPYGVLAMQTLRLEKAFPLYGNDINEDLTPFNMGLDRWIKFDNRDFVGRDALLRTRDRGVARRWVGLVLDSDTPCAFKDKVHSGVQADAAEVGYVTYSNRGHTVGKTLAMAYVDTPYCSIGSGLSIDSQGKRIAATVAPTPFFDPDGTRARA